MDIPKSAEQNYLPKLNFRSNSDFIKNQGRFGLVYKGKLDGKLDVAIKRVVKKKTQVAESQFYFSANAKWTPECHQLLLPSSLRFQIHVSLSFNIFSYYLTHTFPFIIYLFIQVFGE
jgi:hypothetical protein